MDTSFERTDSKDEWLTPKPILDALGPFDLDPCASVVRPWPTASVHYTRKQNGLYHPWSFAECVRPFIWLNPPYGTQTQIWFRRIAEHNHGIALTFARTETRMFFESVWPKATAIYFLKGRLSFCDTTGKAIGTAGAPSCLIAYGAEAHRRLVKCELPGRFIKL